MYSLLWYLQHNGQMIRMSFWIWW